MSKYTGYDAVVYVSISGVYTKVAAQRNATLTRSMEAVDATDKDGSYWAESLAGIKSWELSCDGLVDLADSGYAYLESNFNSRTAVTIRLVTPSGATYTGSAFITELSNEAPHDDAFSYSASFQGTGALTKA